MLRYNWNQSQQIWTTSCIFLFLFIDDWEKKYTKSISTYIDDFLYSRLFAAVAAVAAVLEGLYLM